MICPGGIFKPVLSGYGVKLVTRTSSNTTQLKPCHAASIGEATAAPVRDYSKERSNRICEDSRRQARRSQVRQHTSTYLSFFGKKQIALHRRGSQLGSKSASAVLTSAVALVCVLHGTRTVMIHALKLPLGGMQRGGIARRCMCPCRTLNRRNMPLQPIMNRNISNSACPRPGKMKIAGLWAEMTGAITRASEFSDELKTVVPSGGQNSNSRADCLTIERKVSYYTARVYYLAIFWANFPDQRRALPLNLLRRLLKNATALCLEPSARK